MTAKICFFHTVAGLSERFDELAAEYVPESDHFHIVDESVLDEQIEVGELTPSITNRICTQLSLAERAGADIVLDTCSSTSPAVDVARRLVDIPIVKIDDPMTERAVELGDDIHVLATAASTVEPSTELIARKAEQSDLERSIESTLIDDALEARKRGDIERHDELVTEAALEAGERADVLVLAQASMSHLEPELTEQAPVPVLSSPHLAMERLAETVAEL
ncbi:aspartate/glutamate racemase family protein [Halomontanus rarus]|uniref:aspartate/glutamate racemase family protein n=1 Tax=Halomontanus rarus TaxID=3034020 RepID=UPI001A987A32